MARTANQQNRYQSRRALLAAAPFLLPYLTLFAIFLVGPLVYGFYLSLHEWHLLAPDKKFVGLANYGAIAQDDLFRLALSNTAWYVLLAVPLGNLVSLLLAIGLNSRIRGETFFKVAFYLPTVLSVAVVAVLWRWMYNTEFGIINYYLGRIGDFLHLPLEPIPWLRDPRLALNSFVILSVWWGAGGGMLIYLAGLRAIPETYYEAAVLDGAGPWKRFRFVTWPLLRPTTLFNLVVGLIGAFQLFGIPLIMTNGGPSWGTLTVVLYMYQTGFSLFKMGYGCAVAYTLFVVVLVITVAQFRLLAFREEDMA